MSKLADKYTPRDIQECAFVKVCYIAEAMDCFGYKSDCPLYKKTSPVVLSLEDFHEAVNQLIDKTRAKHFRLL